MIQNGCGSPPPPPPPRLAQPTLVQVLSVFIIKKVNVTFPVLTIFVQEQLHIGRGYSETSCNQPRTLKTRKPVAP